MPRALLSVSDKTDIITLAKGLTDLGWDIVASGGTGAALSNAGIDIVPVERVTGSQTMLGGRVKTLHPAVHAGILARDTEDDFAELRDVGYAPIDLVACNLYPFEEVVSQADVALSDAIENIDIGGVTLLRAAAKNFARVTAVTDPADYETVVQELQANGKVSADTRRVLALKAFAHTRDYDSAIHAYLLRENEAKPELQDTFSLGMHQTHTLRYGENPHQQAGFFAETLSTQPLFSQQLGGKPLSYNNILDADAAWRAVNSFDGETQAAVVIVKHLTPTGIAIGASPEAAFPFALESDPLSAFGGVIAVNQPVTPAFVDALGSLFVEVIIAPDFASEAADQLHESRKNCRLLKVSPQATSPHLEFRSVMGGVLVQERDTGDPAGTEWKVVTERPPSETEMEALKFAWTAVAHVKSNAIVLAHQGATVGMGGGLPSRVDAVKLAVEKAGKQTKGAVLASDAFFPFPDAIQEAAKAGITAVIQPGGALRDQQVIDAANEAGIAMIHSGTRHFRH